MTNILLLVDDRTLRSDMDTALQRSGYLPSHLNGEELLSKLQASPPQAFILAPRPFGHRAIELLRQIRIQESSRFLPVILLVENNKDIDAVLQAELQADAYFTPPYSVRVITVRLRKLLHLFSNKPAREASQRLIFEGLELDPGQQEAWVFGEALHLTRTEFHLLEYLLHHPRKVLSRERILKSVWGLSYLGESRSIDAHVKRLRAKIAPLSSLIETVVGVGYRLGHPVGDAKEEAPDRITIEDHH